MKYLKAIILVMLSMCMLHTSNAQNGNTPKPSLFGNLPESIVCNETELAKIFATSTDQSVAVNFQSSFAFAGVVTANVTRYANLQSAVVKSPLLDNAIFSISKATNPDGSIEYTGRIINQKYVDGFELKKSATGYLLKKINTDNTMHLCHN
jgi:hypothetical protein